MRIQILVCFCVYRTRRVIQSLLLLFVSPPMVLFLLSLAYNAVISERDADINAVLQSTLATVYQSVTSSIREARMLGTWSFAMTCLGVLPNWLMFWCLAWRWDVRQSFIVVENFERLRATPCRTPRTPQSTILQFPLTLQEKKKEKKASGYESNSVTLKIHDVEKFKRIGTILQHLGLGNSSV